MDKFVADQVQDNSWLIEEGEGLTREIPGFWQVYCPASQSASALKGILRLKNIIALKCVEYAYDYYTQMFQLLVRSLNIETKKHRTYFTQYIQSQPAYGS